MRPAGPSQATVTTRGLSPPEMLTSASAASRGPHVNIGAFSCLAPTELAQQGGSGSGGRVWEAGRGAQQRLAWPVLQTSPRMLSSA